MENGFDLLEQKVRKAVDHVKRLRKANKALDDDLSKAKKGLQDAEKRLAALEKERTTGASQAEERKTLERELDGLRKQKDEVRQRIEGLVEVLESLDEEGADS